MKWKVADAKQQLSAVLRAAQEEPQLIYNRTSLVAAVIAAEALEEYRMLQQRHSQRSLGQAFQELRQLCEEEGWTLEAPARKDRANPLVAVLDDVPV